MIEEEINTRNEKIEHEDNLKKIHYETIVKQFVLKQHIKSMSYEGYSIEEIAVILGVDKNFIIKTLQK